MARTEYLCDLPPGYEYKLMQVGDEVRVIGAHKDKPIIIFEIIETKMAPIKIRFKDEKDER